MSVLSDHERAQGDQLSPIAVTFPAAKKITGLGLTSLWKLAKEGRIEVVHVGRRALITFRSLEKLLLPVTNTTPSPRRGKAKAEFRAA